MMTLIWIEAIAAQEFQQNEQREGKGPNVAAGDADAVSDPLQSRNATEHAEPGYRLPSLIRMSPLTLLSLMLGPPTPRRPSNLLPL